MGRPVAGSNDRGRGDLPSRYRPKSGEMSRERPTSSGGRGRAWMRLEHPARASCSVRGLEQRGLSRGRRGEPGRSRAGQEPVPRRRPRGNGAVVEPRPGADPPARPAMGGGSEGGLGYAPHGCAVVRTRTAPADQAADAPGSGWRSGFGRPPRPGPPGRPPRARGAVSGAGSRWGSARAPPAHTSAWRCGRRLRRRTVGPPTGAAPRLDRAPMGASAPGGAVAPPRCHRHELDTASSEGD
jgi:hypothetical protein